jgi:hypothetical protein
MRSTNRQQAGSLLRGVAVAVVIIFAGLAGNALGTYVAGAPRVGSIIAFEPSAARADTKGIRLAVHRADGDACTLDLNVVQRSGGSLVVESQTAGEPIAFHVHWAGERTSDDDADCGPGADLTVKRHYLDLMAAYAGGYGAGPDRSPAYAPAMLQ